MKPYIVCFMITSIDGRIDCDMVEKIEGEDEYTSSYNSYNFDAYISGKTTAILHYANKEFFISKTNEKVGQECYKKLSDGPYLIIADTLGNLMWESNKIDGSKLIVVLSEKVTNDYLNYLENLGISYIVSGKEKIDLKRASEIMHDAFDIKRLAVTGGAKINSSFLKENLLDEIALIIAPGIDGRSNFVSVFDGFEDEKEPTKLSLFEVNKFESGSVLLKYKVLKN